MPLLKLHTSQPVPEPKSDRLMRDLSQIAAGAIGKPEMYVMVAMSSGPMCMGGKTGPAALVEVYSIGGLNNEVNTAISQRVCSLLTRELELDGKRIYLSFNDVHPGDWGWNSSTFG